MKLLCEPKAAPRNPDSVKTRFASGAFYRPNPRPSTSHLYHRKQENPTIQNDIDTGLVMCVADQNHGNPRMRLLREVVVCINVVLSKP